MVSSTPRPHFTPGKDLVPILQEAEWVPGPVWTGGKSRSHRDSIPDRPAISSVTIPTELPGPQILPVKPTVPNMYCLFSKKNKSSLFGRMCKIHPDDLLVCRFGCSIQTCIPEGHLHRVTYTRCRTDTINSPDDGHVAVRNM